MSLMGTLAKVAIGVAVAKGVGSVLQKGATGSAGGGSIFGGANSPSRTGTTGLEDMMGSILGGRRTTGATGGGATGGLGGLLEELAGGGRTSGTTSRSGGGLGEILGGLTGGAGGMGGLGGLLGGLVGAAAGGAGGGSFGEVLNQSFQNGGEPDVTPSPSQEAAAGLFLRAMIQAAKSDGKIDAGEKKKLLDRLGDISAAEREFVNAELAAPVDVQGLARQVPKGLEQQVYAMSVMGIDLDSQAEAKYLHHLAQAMGIGQQMVNAIHEQLGAPKLYT